MGTRADADKEVQRFRAVVEEAKARADLPPEARWFVDVFEEMLMDLETTINAHSNGHAKGRAVPPLPMHTFQDSGITVGIRKIAPSTQQRLHDLILREHPKPQPPVVKTELGPEENAADPDYLARLKQWNEDTNRALSARLFKLACLECEVEVDTQEVERKQAQFKVIGLDWEDDPSLSSEQNAKLFYLQHIACATSDDLKEFYEAVTRRSTPTEAAIQRHIDTFRSDVQGA